MPRCRGQVRARKRGAAGEADERRRFDALRDALLQSAAAMSMPRAARRWSPDELAAFGHLRQAFIAAGRRHLDEHHAPEHWLQVGVTLERRRGELAVLSPRFRERVVEWLRQRRIRAFFYLSKPPGLRLRFAGRALSSRFQPELFGYLDELRAGEQIRGWELGVYDEETHKFGGPVGMNLFHRHATYDSLACMQLLELERRGHLTVDRLVFSLLVVNDLAHRVCADQSELWDLWCNVRPRRRALGRELTDHLEANREVLEQTVFRPRTLLAELSPDERTIARTYFRDNRNLAARLVEAACQGALSSGPRKIVAALAVYHFNRLLIPMEAQLTASFLMQALLDPRPDARR